MDSRNEEAVFDLEVSGYRKYIADDARSGCRATEEE
jgi:hypothetical protein